MTEGFPYELCSTKEPLLQSPGPLKRDGWRYWMQTHPDRIFADTLTLIIDRGVKIGYEGPKDLFINLPPHPTASNAPDVLDKDLQKQLAHDRLTIIELPLQPPSVVSPLGLVPKRDGGFRRIHDLSCPRGSSVNDYIPGSYGSLEYIAVDDAIEAILLVGRGAILIKRDLADAFRHIPIALADRWLLRFLWNRTIYEERFLPFGLRTAPFIFDLFAKALNWMLIAVCLWPLVIHYLDDFLAILPPNADYTLYERHFDLLCFILGLSER